MCADYLLSNQSPHCLILLIEMQIENRNISIDYAASKEKMSNLMINLIHYPKSEVFCTECMQSFYGLFKLSSNSFSYNMGISEFSRLTRYS